MPQLPPSEHIYEVNHYVDEHGRQVRQLLPTGTPADDYVRFRGTAHVELNTGQVLPNGRPHIIGLDLDFAIRGAVNIEEAFAKFDESIEPGVEEFMTKQRKAAADGPRILRPGGG